MTKKPDDLELLKKAASMGLLEDPSDILSPLLVPFGSLEKAAGRKGSRCCSPRRRPRRDLQDFLFD